MSISLLVGTGLLLSVQFRFIQVRYFKQAMLVLFSNRCKKSSSDKLSGFQALSTVLSGTIGTGNIAGVATAIVVGGPGALFWMWVTGFLGMATKFTSCTLGHYYRKKDSQNKIIGGPMITLMHGLKYNNLAKIFAFFMILGTLSTGSMVQANSITEGISYIIPSISNYRLLMGVIISILAGIVIIGGVKRIAHVAEVIVPFMALAYVCTAFFILCAHYDQVPGTFRMIFSHAFSIEAIAGTSIWLVIRSGVARGLFASEAGLGTAPIA
ncbi:MAG: amino acid carrier protein, partial [Gammaproteobacteria bacterium]|nr:amino acid carrier protein [Gammaproteobacteria bacterium]